MSRLLALCLGVVLSMTTGPSFAQAISDTANKEQGTADAGRLIRMHEYVSRATEIEFVTAFQRSSALAGMERRGTAHLFIRRPNSFRVELSSNEGDYVFMSDGTTFTIYRPKSGKYAQIPARDSILSTMYKAIGLIGAQAQLLDFLWAMDYGEQVLVKAHGTETVGSRSCSRLTLRRFDQDWDVWLERDDPPLPCKIVSRATASNDQSVQTNAFVWNTRPMFDPGLFSFTPQKDAFEVSISEID